MEEWVEEEWAEGGGITVADVVVVVVLVVGKQWWYLVSFQKNIIFFHGSRPSSLETYQIKEIK